MKNVLIAAAVAAALSGLPAGAQAQQPQSRDSGQSRELGQIREQIEGLMKRVDRLEQENQALKADNATLKSQGDRDSAEKDYLKSQTRDLREQMAEANTEINKVKGTDWASKVSLKGDVRYRHEEIDDDLANNGSINNKRFRDRIRARLGLEAKVTDHLLVGLQIASGADDPRSSNQTLTGENTRKPIGLDLGYFDWKFASWGDLIGGKMKYPFFKPGNSLFYDGDVNPEGFAFAFNQGIWFGSAYLNYLEERSTAAETLMIGGQAGVKLPIGSSGLTLAVQYNDLVKGKGFRPFYNCDTSTAIIPNTATIACANGNSVIGANQSAGVLQYDFNTIQLSAEFNTSFGSLPFQVWADYLKNQDPDDLNTALGVGVLLGKASNYRTWEAGFGYQKIEKDSVFGQWVDSDFGDGKTDAKGWILRVGYAPLKNWALNATYFINTRQMDVGPESDYNRLQVDFNAKF